MNCTACAWYSFSSLFFSLFFRHFTIRGAEGTDFEGGVYHGRILLPPEYPFKPPHIVFLTPSGRFETGTKVCLSFSAYHPELWQPAWGIRLILEALISFLPTPADGAIGALDWTSAERKKLAQRSIDYCCPRCGNAAAMLPERKAGDSKPRFTKEIEQLRLLQAAHESKDKTKKKDGKTEQKDDEENDNEEAPLVEETTVPPPPPTITTASQLQEEPPAANGNAVEESAENVPLVPDEPQDAAEPPIVQMSWLSDNVLHTTIIVLAALCYLLYHKTVSLYEEIQALNQY
jgi:ubiquitin-conjugating enzyme E2 J1